MVYNSLISENLFHIKGRLNDFWRYNTTSQQWAWLTGDQAVDKEGSYGPFIYFPGARTNGGTWSDSNDNLYLYGGFGITISSTGNLYFIYFQVESL